MPLPRPQVNLDAVAAVFDRVLESPVAAVANELLPETMRSVRDARNNLPALASGLEARAVEQLRHEARDLERELTGAVTRWVQETIRKGRGEAPVKRLRAKPRAAARTGKGKKR